MLVVPSLAGYGFAPSAQSLLVLSNTSLPDFMAFPSLALAQVANGAFQLAFAPAFTCQVLASSDLSHWQPSPPTTSPPTRRWCSSLIATPRTFPCAFTGWGRLLRHRPCSPTWSSPTTRFRWAAWRLRSWPAKSTLRPTSPPGCPSSAPTSQPPRPSSSGTTKRLICRFASTACPKPLVFKAAGLARRADIPVAHCLSELAAPLHLYVFALMQLRFPWLTRLSSKG